MFSRLCKNSIFPSGSSSSAATGERSTAVTAEASTSSANGPAAVVVVGPTSSSPSRRRHLNLPLPVLPPRSTVQIRPEPPPPYWAHYQHRPVVPQRYTSSSQSNSSSRSSDSEGASAPAPPQASNAQRAAPSSTVRQQQQEQQQVVQQRAHRRNIAGGGISELRNPGAPARPHRYNIAHQPQPQQRHRRIKEHLLSQDAFCPDLVRNCKITADPQSGRNTPIESEPVPSTSSNRPSGPQRQDHPDQDVYVEIEELNRSLSSAQLGSTNSNTTTNANTTDPKGTKLTDSSNIATTTIGTVCDMGQNLSIRRPKISLTWVLREQAQQQQQQQPQLQQVPPQNHQLSGSQSSGSNSSHHHKHHHHHHQTTQSRRSSPVKTILANGSIPVSSPAIPNGHVPARKKSRTRSKERLFSEKYVSDNNLTQYHSEKQQKVPHSLNGSSAPPSTEHHGIYRKSNRSYRKSSDRLKKKERALIYPNLVQSETVDILLNNNNNNNNNSIIINLNQEDQLPKDKSVICLKNTYSEPSLYTTVSEPSSSKKHRHRRRRERYRSQRFGYEIQNVDEFLSKCSLSSPGNIPVVLSSAATLYQTRPGSYQVEIPLPLGMVVNAVFKNQNWLYVQTPHAEEGYVAYETCLPLGILPPNQRSSSTSKPTPCWESNKDVFPRPSGNLTDSEKEIQQMRGGTRSEGRRTPRLKRGSTNSRSTTSITCNSEKNLDSLYLRVANQPKSIDSQTQFAQLKLTTKVLNPMKLDNQHNLEKLTAATSNASEYVHLQKQQTQNPYHHHHHHKILVKSGSGGSGGSGNSVINGGHYHKTVNSASYTNGNSNGSGSNSKLVNGNSNLRPMAATATTAVRQTLLAITDNYCSDSVSVQKGDVVTLLACKEYQEKGLKNFKQWFFVRTRDGHEGYIPAEAAGHGFL